jgi:hypothetical protein
MALKMTVAKCDLAESKMTAKRNMGLKIPALKAITNNKNMTAEERFFGIINDCWNDFEKYDS